jgi:hypothetical protein
MLPVVPKITSTRAETVVNIKLLNRKITLLEQRSKYDRLSVGSPASSPGVKIEVPQLIVQVHTDVYRVQAQVSIM